MKVEVEIDRIEEIWRNIYAIQDAIDGKPLGSYSIDRLIEAKHILIGIEEAWNGVRNL